MDELFRGQVRHPEADLPAEVKQDAWRGLISSFSLPLQKPVVKIATFHQLSHYHNLQGKGVNLI